jgi:hypothetical protein
MRTGWPYLRYSEDRQGEGDSERRQTTWHDRKAREHGLRLDYSLKLEDKGKSAFHGEHLKADLGRFLNAINNNVVKPGDVFLFEEMDRLSRQDLSKALPLFLGILAAGVDILTEKRLYTEADMNDLGVLIGVICDMKTANEESRKKSRRVGENWENWRQQIAEGKKVPPPGKMPAWVRWNGTEFEAIPEAVAAIKLIFKWVTEGFGIDKVLARLNGEAGQPKVPPITKTPTWGMSYVASLLIDRSVLGELKVKGGIVHEGFYPPAVTQAEWLLTRRALEARTIGRKGVGRKGKEVSNLFSGLLHDAHDGQRMHLHPHGWRNGKLRTAYVSCGALRGEKASTWRMLPVGLLEAAIMRFVRELKVGDLLGGDRSRDEEQLRLLEGKQADLEQRIAKAKRQVDTNPENAEDVFEFLTRWRGELKQGKQEMETLAAKLKTDEAACLHDAQQLIDLFRKAPEGERGELRERLKARIREVIQRLDALTWDVDKTTRAAEVQVTLRGGNVRAILFAWTHKGRYPGLSVAISLAVGKPGADAHLADKRLCEYPSNPAVREWAAGHTETLRGAIQEAVAAEMKHRETLAATDRELGGNRLQRFLDTATLDGTPPPARKGGRPRKPAVERLAG